VITESGGSLGLTDAFGVSDPSITRSRVEKDLEVLESYHLRYRGMVAACHDQLQWAAERYARWPHQPELLELKSVPPLWKGLIGGFVTFFVFFALLPWVLLVVLYPFGFRYADEQQLPWPMLEVIGLTIFLVLGARAHFRAQASNGNRPRENARRQREYEAARASALDVAQTEKLVQDHRLRVQLREVEGLMRTVAQRKDEVRHLLGTL
jgi:hypothetical protein